MKLNRPFYALAIMVIAGMLPIVVIAQTPANADSHGPATAQANTPSGRQASPSVSLWLTNPDQSALFQRQPANLMFAPPAGNHPTITVDTSSTFQTMDGFGYTLTGGSASLIDGLHREARQALLRELFSTDSGCIGISYLRISIGSSDMDASVFSYDDMPAGKKDPALTDFTIARDQQHLIPILRSILALNPHIKILGSPWSAPSWMKDNDTTKGGRLDPANYKVYALYLVKYIQAMKAAGIPIDAITPQNEPMNPKNNPSMVVTDTAEAAFVRTALGPAFQQAGLTTKIIVWDHNCDMPEYPLYILGDAAAAAYVDGSAFHLYMGDVSALSTVHNAYPHKNIYFTEEYTAGGSSFAGDLSWHVANLIIGAPRNWARNVLEWNLAADPNLNPHTPGGCNTCLGALTIGSSVTRNVSYYIIAHAAKFVRPGSVRVASTMTDGLPNVAYQTPAGKKVLIVLNQTGTARTFNISFRGQAVTTTLMAGAVGTYVW